MLDKKLWLSFTEGLTESDIEDMESRVRFLRDITEEALSCDDTEEAQEMLDLDIHVYLSLASSSKGSQATPWLIHNCWLGWHDDGKALSPPLRDRLRRYFLRPVDDVRACLTDILACIGEHTHIRTEGEAVMWLSMLDYLATRIVTKIEHGRLDAVFANALRNAEGAQNG